MSMASCLSARYGICVARLREWLSQKLYLSYPAAGRPLDHLSNGAPVEAFSNEMILLCEKWSYSSTLQTLWEKPKCCLYSTLLDSPWSSGKSGALKECEILNMLLKLSEPYFSYNNNFSQSYHVFHEKAPSIVLAYNIFSTNVRNGKRTLQQVFRSSNFFSGWGVDVSHLHAT